MNDYELFSLSVDIGCEIIRNGGEIYRAKDTIQRINGAFDRDCTVFALPDLIIAQSGSCFLMKEIDGKRLDMDELERLNSLSRKITYYKNEEIFITVNKTYSYKENLIFTALAVFCFCIFFGGNVLEALISGGIGIFITAAPYRKREIATFSSNLIDAFAVGILSMLPSLFITKYNSGTVIIGTFLVLVPGLNILSAMRDMLQGEILAGAFELIESIMSALAIALSVGAALYLFKII